MICPDCYKKGITAELVTIESDRHELYTYRRRRCPVCIKIFPTYEHFGFTVDRWKKSAVDHANSIDVTPKPPEKTEKAA